MKINKAEWEIIEHRLGVPDCVAEAMAESWPNDDVESTASALYDQVKQQQRLPDKSFA